MPIRSTGKFKTLLFSLYFLNKHISFNIPRKILKFDMHIHDDDSEGTVSQICYQGPSFHFMNSRKNFFRKCQKVTRFLT